jgi:hypothetical protein
VLPVLDLVELLLPLPGPLLEEQLVVPVLDGGLQKVIRPSFPVLLFLVFPVSSLSKEK